MHRKRRLRALRAGLGVLAMAGTVAVLTVGHSAAQTPPGSPVAQSACPAWPTGGYGPGMMGGGGGSGPGMMGGSGSGPGAQRGAPTTASVPQTMDDATHAITQAARQWGIPSPTVTEVMEFQCNYYGVVANGTTGQAATEMLVDKTTGATFIEYGPAMMWNTQYGMLGGFARMMAGFPGLLRGWGSSTAPASMTADQARQDARQWLDAHQPGSTTGDSDTLPGYFTLHIMQNGQMTGMLSVNAYSGAVWFHSWHGAFIQMQSSG